MADAYNGTLRRRSTRTGGLSRPNPFQSPERIRPSLPANTNARPLRLSPPWRALRIGNWIFRRFNVLGSIIFAAPYVSPERMGFRDTFPGPERGQPFYPDMSASYVEPFYAPEINATIFLPPAYWPYVHGNIQRGLWSTAPDSPIGSMTPPNPLNNPVNASLTYASVLRDLSARWDERRFRSISWTLAPLTVGQRTEFFDHYIPYHDFEAPGFTPAGFHTPRPNPANFWRYQVSFQFDPATGTHRTVNERVFDGVGYQNAIREWDAQYAAHQAHEQYLYERQVEHDRQQHEAAEARDRQTQLEEYQMVVGRIKLKNSAEFVLTNQPSLSLQKRTDRKNYRGDRKGAAAQGYRTFLRFLNETYGAGEEIYDYFDAAFNNLVGTTLDGRPIPGTIRYIEDGEWVYRPKDWKTAVKLWRGGFLELDMFGFAQDVIYNQLEDRAFGILGSGIADFSRLTGRDVGLTAGPAL